jgi:hypothetical protein
MSERRICQAQSNRIKPNQTKKTGLTVRSRMSTGMIGIRCYPNLPVLFATLFPSRRGSATRIPSLVADGASMPIRMAPFPSVKTAQSEVVTDQPGSSRPQVIIRAAHQADVFVAIPDIRVGHAKLHDRPRHADFHHWWSWDGDCHSGGPNIYRATRGQSGGDGQQTLDSTMIRFHTHAYKLGDRRDGCHSQLARFGSASKGVKPRSPPQSLAT